MFLIKHSQKLGSPNLLTKKMNADKQRGVVLVMALIMVLLMTIVALSSIRGSGLQEAMAGNMRDRNVAFQSCEAALRNGESALTAKILPSFKGTQGRFIDLDSPSNPALSVTRFSLNDWSTKAIDAGVSIPDVAASPKYLLEQVNVRPIQCARGDGSALNIDPPLTCKPYRISCQGVGMTTENIVVVQSAFKRIE